jgi:hypothetical protein
MAIIIVKSMKLRYCDGVPIASSRDIKLSLESRMPPSESPSSSSLVDSLPPPKSSGSDSRIAFVD